MSLPLDKLLPWRINVLNLLLILNGALPHSSACCLALQFTVVRERYHTPLWKTETSLRLHREPRSKSRSCIKNETRTCWHWRNLAAPVCSKANDSPFPSLVAFGSHRELATWTILFISLPMGNQCYMPQRCSERNHVSSELCFSFCRLRLHTGRCSRQGMAATVFWFIHCFWVILRFCNTEEQLPWGKG